jgi:tRNA pseudouridine55 synthase
MANTFNFLEGEYLFIDKPLTWTSFDVVNKVRFILKYHAGIDKIKVGHSGTLDPLATGLLLLCTGKYTKKINELTGLDKEYTGTIMLGGTTPSGDLETEIDRKFPYDHVTEEAIEEARKSFLGEIRQTPPIYSAQKIDGKRAYIYARNKEDVEMRARNVTIHAFDITRVELPEIDFRVVSSKGTYIRTLAYDLGQKLNSGSHLTSLRRTKIGEFSVEDALNPEQFEFLVQSMSQG